MVESICVIYTFSNSSQCCDNIKNNTLGWTGVSDQHLMAASFNTFQCLSSRGQWSSTYRSERVQAVTVDPQQWRCWAPCDRPDTSSWVFLSGTFWLHCVSTQQLFIHFTHQPAQYTHGAGSLPPVLFAVSPPTLHQWFNMKLVQPIQTLIRPGRSTYVRTEDSSHTWEDWMKKWSCRIDIICLSQAQACFHVMFYVVHPCWCCVWAQAAVFGLTGVKWNSPEKINHQKLD